MNRVVPLHPPHNHIRGDRMEMKLGNTIVRFDDSYIRSRTPEQEQKDLEALDEAMWLIADELYERETA